VAEQRAQQIGQCGEGELRLGLGTAGPDNRDGIASAFGQRLEQRCRSPEAGMETLARPLLLTLTDQE
jgi:hypothetical protein